MAKKATLPDSADPAAIADVIVPDTIADAPDQNPVIVTAIKNVSTEEALLTAASEAEAKTSIRRTRAAENTATDNHKRKRKDIRSTVIDLLQDPAHDLV